jgi:ketosteroid isomerase-like protein
MCCFAVVVFVACGAPAGAPAPREPAPRRAPVATRFATALANDVARGDTAGAAGLFAPDAHVELVGDRGERTDIAGTLRALTAAFSNIHVEIGRVWIDRPQTTAVIELVFSGRAGDRDVGVAGAAVVTFRDDRATALRLYLDLVTALGQIDRSRVPAQLSIRGLEPHPTRGVFVATGAANEAANLSVANAVWDALDAHDADRVLATASDDYRYIDYAAPKVLSRNETRDMVAGFLAIATGFRIAAKPVQFAAGDFVITEMVERAAPTGKEIELHGLDIKRITNGHVVEEWQYSNYFEVLGQLAGIAKPVLP